MPALIGTVCRRRVWHQQPQFATGALMRPSGRAADVLRPISLTPGFSRHAEGSCLIRMGNTEVLCAASVEGRVPPFMRNSGQGWVTAEYGMLPRATHTRDEREAARGKRSGRTQEIQRLIGRALRAVVDRSQMGEVTVTLDCGRILPHSLALPSDDGRCGPRPSALGVVIGKIPSMSWRSLGQRSVKARPDSTRPPLGAISSDSISSGCLEHDGSSHLLSSSSPRRLMRLSYWPRAVARTSEPAGPLPRRALDYARKPPTGCRRNE